MKSRLGAAGMALLVLGSVTLVGAGPAQAASKVTICHRTHSTTNPYRKITVSQSATVAAGKARNHAHHTGPAFVPGYAYPPNAKIWGDIIPFPTSLPAGVTCGALSAAQFYDLEREAGQSHAAVVADLVEQEADADIAAGLTDFSAMTYSGTWSAGQLATAERVANGELVTPGAGETGTVGPPTDTASGDEPPADPTPVDPTPIDPFEPTIDPAPVDPTPADPEGETVGPGTTPSDPTPPDPAPSDPTPSDPTPANPDPTDPTPGDPTPADPPSGSPAPTDPTPVDVPTDPADPTTADPAPGDPPANGPTPADPPPPGPTPTPTPTPTDPTPGADPGPEAPAPPTNPTPPSGYQRIDGTVWLDLDRDGKRDPGEVGVPGARVQLFRLTPATVAAVRVPGGAGTGDVLAAWLAPTITEPVDVQTTDASGAFAFPDLPTGTYRVAAARPAALTVTFDGDDELDAASDMDLPVDGHGIADVGLVGEAALDVRTVDTDGQPLGDGGIRVRWAGLDGELDTDDDVLLPAAVVDGEVHLAGVPAGLYRVEQEGGLLASQPFELGSEGSSSSTATLAGPGAGPVDTPDGTSTPDPGTTPDPTTEPDPVSAPDPTTDPVPTTDPEPSPDPVTTPDPSTDPEPPADPDPVATPDLSTDLGPVDAPPAAPEVESAGTLTADPTAVPVSDLLGAGAFDGYGGSDGAWESAGGTWVAGSSPTITRASLAATGSTSERSLWTAAVLVGLGGAMVAVRRRLATAR